MRILLSFIVLWLIFPGSAFSQSPDAAKTVSRDKKRFVNIFPENVKTIALIAPGSHPAGANYKQGIELLREAGYNLIIMPHAFVRQKKAARAPLAGRLADFYGAWNNPEVDMILCLRGGIGSEEVLDNIDWSKLKPRPELYFRHRYKIPRLLFCFRRL